MVGNTVFNTILIDKIRMYAPIELLENLDIKDFVENLENRMIIHYPNNAYLIKTSRNALTFTFTPTRYRTSSKDTHTDTNLVMPVEEELHNLFLELGFYNLEDAILNAFNISILHLTKNLYMDMTIPNYIKFLKNRNYKGRIKPVENYSNSFNSSLVLTSLKKDNKEKDCTGFRKSLFYDKVQELLDKAKLNEITLRLPLSDDEILLLPKGVYNQNTLNLNLENLHILRCELQYKNKVYLHYISNFLTGKRGNNDLKLATILDLLKEGKLYKSLESFYATELRNKIFYNIPCNNPEQLNKYEQLLAELIKEESATALLAMYEKHGYKESLKNVINKIQQTTTSKLYVELYEKFEINRQNENPQDESRLLTVLDSG